MKHCYEMNLEQIKSIIAALEGNNDNKTLWLDKLHKWINFCEHEQKMLKLAEKWLIDFAKKTKVHIKFNEWQTEEENLMSWVYYQMEYMNGLAWDDETQKVIINKYHPSRPRLNETNTQDLLDFITEELNNDIR